MTLFQSLLVAALLLGSPHAFSPSSNAAGNPRGENSRAQQRLERIRAQRAAAQAKAQAKNPLTNGAAAASQQPKTRSPSSPLPVGPTSKHEVRLQQVRANRRQELAVMTATATQAPVAVESLTQLIGGKNDLSLDVQDRLEQVRINEAASQVYSQLYQTWHAELERLERDE
mmetsp:Transcript_14939/g.41307  ORF Transcript_14939/g.41307 Transcript_14939/m.41307 type:complete len:171 (-) Transcript_14939:364-876(-)|eukprot:CAMPEP_0168755872 /NCGR_PEP_ID=MMETSP0724-20121128/20301_1 /TAXON_ID=265536 /ORGANISM="Amphiprora sp., Strain CCMP467" /LENGTH=170 /DNA_ID=CAMNT_0008804517 /DNA_START=98 /DNA_END=610 /DNA_ORIENTATION=-